MRKEYFGPAVSEQYQTCMQDSGSNLVKSSRWADAEKEAVATSLGLNGANETTKTNPNSAH